MSFEFPERVRVPESTNNSPGLGYENHFKLMRYSGPDYDELIIPLSLYAFNRLSPSDQQEKLDEIRIHHEESDFTKLFKELNYSDQVKFLSKVVQKLMFERIIPSFKQLNAEHQQLVIEQIAHGKSSRYRSLHRQLVTPENLRRGPKETEEDFRLAKLTELCKGRTGEAHKIIDAWKSGSDQQEEETSDDGKSCFSEFFLGFSNIWFQGQWASGQDMLIEQLSEGVGGGVVKKYVQNESEEDFKLTRFTELCMKVVDFSVQEKFLQNADLKLQGWEWDHSMSVIEPKDYDSAAELLSDLSTLGLRLLSAKYQQHKIEEMSKQVESDVKTKRHLAAVDMQASTTDAEEEEAIRIRRFKELFNQVSIPTRIDVFKELRKILLEQKHYSEAVHFFCGLGPEDQEVLIKKLAHKMRDSAEILTEIFSSGSEEELRLRIFKNVCTKHLSTWGYIPWPEADKESLQQGTDDHKDEETPYAEFLFDVSDYWFKARCTDYKRNPIHVLLSGKFKVIEKLPEESEEDFRHRRFRESFKQLQCSSQERIVNYIQAGLFGDLGYPVSDSELLWLGFKPPAEGRGSFDSEWIKIKLPNLQGQRAAATTPQVVSAAGGSATTTQVGGRIVNR